MKTDFLKVLAELPDALEASERSRLRRNAAAGRLIAPPPPGTPLLVTLSLVLEHTGIYMGNNRVAELGGDGNVRLVSLSRFINGSEDDLIRLRTGTRIFAACDKRTRRALTSRTAKDTARTALSSPRSTRYDIATVNCHQFTAACINGVLPTDSSFPRQLGSGMASIDKLERVIENALNDGDRMAWCAIARSKDRFRYKLTADKIARLHLEGIR